MARRPLVGTADAPWPLRRPQALGEGKEPVWRDPRGSPVGVRAVRGRERCADGRRREPTDTATLDDKAGFGFVDAILGVSHEGRRAASP